MSQCRWIARKGVDHKHIERLLQPSIDLNHMTNSGVAVERLEALCTTLFGVDTSRKRVICVCNGSAAMHALVSGIAKHKEAERLRFATQAFTFPTSCQSVMDNSVVLDVDEHGGIDLEQVELHRGELDGIVVTNAFGHLTDVARYESWCKERGMLLVFDNATTPYSLTPQGDSAVNYGDGCIVSLHHTKPAGFGEGGVIVCSIEYEASVRQCINFGFAIQQNVLSWDPRGSNYKMCDNCAVYIESHLLSHWDEMLQCHAALWNMVRDMLAQSDKIRLYPHHGDTVPFVSCIPLLFDRAITSEDLYTMELSHVTVRKYYKPLISLPNAQHLYDHIMCIPCHVDITPNQMRRILEHVQELTQ